MSYNLFNDRRRFLRRPHKAPVLFHFSETIKGSGRLKDMGVGGVCVVTPEPFAFYRPEQAHVFLEKKMLVSLPSESIVIKGTIVRVDAARYELAISITHTSDNEKWKRLSR